MTFLAGFLAALAAVFICWHALAYARRQKFPKDHCRDCRAPVRTEAERNQRTDEQIDRMARKIHARMMRESHG